jgi:mycothiol synthase
VAVLEVEVHHRLDPATVAEVAALQSAAAAAGIDEPLAEQSWLDLSEGGGRGSVDLLARTGDDHHLVGAAHLVGDGGLFSVEAVAYPPNGDPAEVRRALLDQARRQVADRGGGQLQYWVHHCTAARDREARRLGFRPVRTLRQLRVALPLAQPSPSLPDDLVLRPFRVGSDEKAWLEVNNRAFAGHPEQGGWDLDTLRRRESAPWFDAEGFLLAEDRGGRLLGSCWTKVHRDTDPPMGEIYVISVDPALHQRGLGRALTAAGLAHLSGLGLGVGMLYVDDANQPALALYASLGFETDHIDRAYAVEVGPGPGLQWTETPTSRPTP